MAEEVTGDFWKYDSKLKKYWGEFDTNAELTFPFSLNKWIADPTADVLSVTPNGYGVFELDETLLNRRFLVKVKLADDAEFIRGIKYPFSVKFKDTNGEVDEWTFYLKLIDK